MTAKTNMKDLVDNLEKHNHSPRGMQKAGYDFLDEVLDNKIEVVEANNPLTFLLEVCTATVAAGVRGYKNNIRYTYSSLARTTKDLHRFMSDEDFEDIYALPGSAISKVTISIESIEKYGVVNNVTNSKTIRIPKDTYITVNGAELVLTKAIVITRHASEAFIVYEELEDGTKNVLNHSLQKNTDELSWIEFYAVTKHLHIRTLLSPMVRSTAFDKSVELVRDFHKVEVFHRKNGTWNVMRLSFSNELQDLNTPTALITLLDNKLNISIARHHLESGAVGNDIKVVVYTTGGETYSLRSVDVEDIKISYRRVDNDSNLTAEEKNLPAMTVIIKPVTPIENSRKALTFEELKVAVNNNNLGRNKYPITRGDVGFKANLTGYNIYKAIDILTSRQYIAGRKALSPIGYKNDLTTPIDMCNRRVNISYDTLKGIDGIKRGLTGKWLTIPAKTLVKITDTTGIVKSNSLFSNIKGKPLTDRINLLTPGDLYYTPYSIHVNYEDRTIKVTPYDTLRPEVESLWIKERNTSIESMMNTYSTSMKYEDGYYVLRTTTKSTGMLHDIVDATNELNAILTFMDGSDIISYNGEFVSKTEEGEFLYEFKIPTDLELDGEFITILDSDTRSVKYKVPLVNKFRITYSLTNVPLGFSPNNVIDVYSKDNKNGLNVDLISVRFATIVDGLWNHVTTIKTGDVYQRHTEDVPYRHLRDVYERNEAGDLVGTEPNCKGTVKRIGKKGDVVVDKDSHIAYRYRKGDVVLDENKAKVLATPVSFTHYLDMMLIDSTPLFSNNANLLKYLEDTESKLYRDSTSNLKPLRKLMLEKTEMHFKPISTIGFITAATEFSTDIRISSQIDMELELQVGSSIFNSEVSKENIERSVIKIIAEYFNKETLARSELISEIRKKIGEPVIDVDITKFMRGNNVVSITDDSFSFSIKKKLVPVSDDSYKLEDDVKITFKNFDIT